MERFEIKETKIKDVFTIEPLVHEDKRGYFVKTYDDIEFKEKGINYEFVQDDQSKSAKGVLRGLHFQKKHPQGKLVRVIKGKVFDVGVDLRKNSPTYGQWIGEILSEKNKKQLFIPAGFAHGFLSLEDDSIFVYKVTEYYYPGDEGGINWNDPNININWPLENINKIIMSDKDKQWKSLKETNFSY